MIKIKQSNRFRTIYKKSRYLSVVLLTASILPSFSAWSVTNGTSDSGPQRSAELQSDMSVSRAITGGVVMHESFDLLSSEIESQGSSSGTVDLGAEASASHLQEDTSALIFSEPTRFERLFPSLEREEAMAGATYRRWDWSCIAQADSAYGVRRIQWEVDPTSHTQIMRILGGPGPYIPLMVSSLLWYEAWESGRSLEVNRRQYGGWPLYVLDGAERIDPMFLDALASAIENINGANDANYGWCFKYKMTLPTRGSVAMWSDIIINKDKCLRFLSGTERLVFHFDSNHPE